MDEFDYTSHDVDYYLNSHQSNLSLSDVRVGDKRLFLNKAVNETFYTGLLNNCYLTSIQALISYSFIEEADFEFLAQLLLEHISLRNFTFCASYSNACAANLACLGSAIAQAPYLRRLSLIGSMPTADLEIFADGLKQNDMLTQLDLSLDGPKLEMVLDAIKGKTNLTKLSIFRAKFMFPTPLSFQGLAKLNGILKTNPIHSIAFYDYIFSTNEAFQYMYSDVLEHVELKLPAQSAQLDEILLPLCEHVRSVHIDVSDATKTMVANLDQLLTMDTWSFKIRSLEIVGLGLEVLRFSLPLLIDLPLETFMVEAATMTLHSDCIQHISRLIKNKTLTKLSLRGWWISDSVDLQVFVRGLKHANPNFAFLQLISPQVVPPVDWTPLARVCVRHLHNLIHMELRVPGVFDVQSTYCEQFLASTTLQVLHLPFRRAPDVQATLLESYLEQLSRATSLTELGMVVPHIPADPQEHCWLDLLAKVTLGIPSLTRWHIHCQVPPDYMVQRLAQTVSQIPQLTFLRWPIETADLPIWEKAVEDHLGLVEMDQPILSVMRNERRHKSLLDWL